MHKKVNEKKNVAPEDFKIIYNNSLMGSKNSFSKFAFTDSRHSIQELPCYPDKLFLSI